MLDFIKDILTTEIGSFSFIFGLMAVAFWAVKKIGEITSDHKVLTKTNEKIESKLDVSISKIESKLDDIRQDLSYVKGTIEVFKNNNETIKTDVDYLKNDVGALKYNVATLQQQNSSLALSHSPLRLSAEGEEVANDISASSMVDNNWSVIYEKIKKNVGNKSAYDIQQYCLIIATNEIESLFLEEDVAKLKNYAFNNGKFMQYYAIVFALIMRDKYFKIENILMDNVDIPGADLFNDNYTEIK